MKLVTAEQMRQMDREAMKDFQIPGLILMENAGAGCVSLILELMEEETAAGVCVVAGVGNNGGDGFVLARHLWNNGFDVEVYLLGDVKKMKGDARTNFEIITRQDLPITEVRGSEEMDILSQDLDSAGLIVDALFGTGLDREIRGAYREVIEAINQSGTPVFAVDMPSGLNADTGQPMPVAVFAEITGTFGMAKIGQFNYPGHLFCGDVHIIDISLPGHFPESAPSTVSVIEPEDFVPLFQARADEAHKGDFGHVCVLGGAPGMTGAPALTALAALRIGAGLCTLGVPEGLNLAMEAKLTEVITRPLPQGKEGVFGPSSLGPARELLRDKSVLALGPGMGCAKESALFLAELLSGLDIPLVIDADGLNNLVGRLDLLKKCSQDLVLTPHPGEMARLTGKKTEEVMMDRLGIASSFAVEHGVILVLKGARSVVAAPDGRLWINPTGNPGMATAGSGDILTGIIAGLMAQGYRTLDSVLAGTYLHGFAGDLAEEKVGQKGMIASDILNELPKAVKSLEALFQEDEDSLADSGQAEGADILDEE